MKSTSGTLAVFNQAFQTNFAIALFIWVLWAQDKPLSRYAETKYKGIAGGDLKINPGHLANKCRYTC
jgi:hypothetical protein